MSETQYGDVQECDLITFGQGGLIHDVPQNQELLGQIQKTPALSLEALLKLANFYKGYPTNTPLGNHLALLAASTLEERTVPQLGIVFKTDFTGIVDGLEDNLILGDNKGRNVKHEKTEGENIRLSVRSINVAGIGLLIETLTFINVSEPTEQTELKVMDWHFVIGVSPSPDSLPPIDTSTTVG